MSISLKKENKKPLIVGLTGGIGSGKSTIATVFQSLGVPIFNSDIEAKKIINNDAEVRDSIVVELGNVYQDGVLDKVKLAEIVFNDSKALDKLNKIVHPKVAECFEEWLKENIDAPIVVKEAAILIESGAYKHTDKVVLVTAPKKIRIQRVVNRDKVSKEKVKERMRAQLSDDDKLSYADFVIINDDNQLVILQVVELYKKLVSL